VILAKKLGAKLTFDDGLKEHYKVAFPILKKYEMKGTFFVITNSSAQLCTTHKVWLLLKQHREELTKKLKISNKRIPKLLPNFYQHESIRQRNLKYYLSTHEDFVNDYFEEYFDEDKEIKKMYMTLQEAGRISDYGMEIGSHGHTHKMMNTLSKTEQKDEISSSTIILSEMLGKQTLGFSYPYGQYNKTTIDLLKRYKYKYAVTTDSEDLFKLRRIDANEFC
jgi:peptidoglycan/xylan/chitin deacetylase (PgdA/CDA1 family)